MSLSEELEKINTIFIDTAPVIYYIEAHPQFEAALSLFTKHLII